MKDRFPAGPWHPATLLVFGLLALLFTAPAAALNTSRQDAARLLTQGTFGPTLPEIQACARLGPAAWIQAQFQAPVSLHLPRMRATVTDEESMYNRRMEIWWEYAMGAPDQLRQRVAFALSEILVVSEIGSLVGEYPFAQAYYYDILVRNAFGNYRNLIQEVTLSPPMGAYLGMLGNQKADLEEGIRPDENFAREVMQLFTIGLELLNPDGSRVLNGAGEAVPTYDQEDVKALARVFTGWTTAGTTAWWDPDQDRVTEPMVPWENYHDRGAKTVLGVDFAAGVNARAELNRALSVLFNHPNVGPFIGRQLIQRLVTSNPTPRYVERVSSVFADNGQGVRGDLAAVVRAILLDPEARNGHNSLPDTFGKLREPLLRASHLWRAFNASARNGTYAFHWPLYDLAQGPLQSPSVFNFFRPDFAPSGALRDAGMVAPEFQLATDNALVRLNNFLVGYIHLSPAEFRYDPTHIVLNLTVESRLANNIPALLNRLNLLLMNGRMSTEMRALLQEHLEPIPYHIGDWISDGLVRALDAIWLITASPEYAVQR